MLIFQDPSDPAYLLIRMNDHTSAAVIAKLQDAWKKVFPQFPVSYFFLDQHLLQQYKDEENLFTLLFTLSLLSIGISCIGLVAYTSYIIRIAIFDIAVRRVLGASFADIFKLFGRQFAILLGIAFLTASPVSWYFTRKWLNQFSYHENIQLTDYLIALGLMAVIVSVVILHYTKKCTRISPTTIIREQ
jgi:ABC-type antimicrobial peptide transport system permease subunit